jgi:hypothetical protein
MAGGRSGAVDVCCCAAGRRSCMVQWCSTACTHIYALTQFPTESGHLNVDAVESSSRYLGLQVFH